jgi:hypothetical protein
MMADQNLLDRVRRADSWIKASARLQSDQLHEAFVFLYIAFNCLYGRRQYEGDETRIGEDLKAFFGKILELAAYDRKDGGEILQQAIKASSKDGALLIRDRFLDHRYWKRALPVERLHEALKSDAKAALEQVAAGEYGDFLFLTFTRISVMRNQIMHGCATYGPATAGRSSLAVAVRLMKVVIPAFQALVRNSGQHASWEPVPYPRLGSAPHLR